MTHKEWNKQAKTGYFLRKLWYKKTPPWGSFFIPVLLLFFAENNSVTEKSHNRSRGRHADKVIGAGGGVLGRFGSRGGVSAIVSNNDGVLLLHYGAVVVNLHIIRDKVRNQSMCIRIGKGTTSDGNRCVLGGILSA